MSDECEKYFKELADRKVLTLQMLKFFSEYYGERFWKALKAVVDGLIKKYVFTPSNRVEWIIIGKKRDYLIVSELYCSCQDFYMNVVLRKNAVICYHLLARRLAEALDCFEEIRVEDNKYEKFMCEWREIEDS
ncbi:MAG: SWIM zinc finger family protein [Candidatus Odinarchaeum yellowstonii]|uniref:SWIM zinc finger family protein n=1 Tax=Odinarchaeota yellowstonii (strain LCB_4) TaxID=1841599 RepID=A0AAF0D3B5_ODILC|nr:MAG: SWIM zinc finger family protein [Candidatus Odinarchaeum yellowstonii]